MGPSFGIFSGYTFERDIWAASRDHFLEFRSNRLVLTEGGEVEKPGVSSAKVKKEKRVSLTYSVFGIFSLT